MVATSAVVGAVQAEAPRMNMHDRFACGPSTQHFTWTIPISDNTEHAVCCVTSQQLHYSSRADYSASTLLGILLFVRWWPCIALLLALPHYTYCNTFYL
jgi:hypothetical protein